MLSDRGGFIVRGADQNTPVRWKVCYRLDASMDAGMDSLSVVLWCLYATVIYAIVLFAPSSDAG